MVLAQQIQQLCRAYHLIAIYAFGSRAMEIAARCAGKQPPAMHAASDVDVGVLPARAHVLTAEDRVALTVALEDLLDVERVDLVVLPEAPPFLAVDIVRGPLLCTTDADAEAEYQLYVLRRAGDLVPFERERLRLLLEGKVAYR